MKKLIFAVLLATATPLMAAEDVTVKVNGLVCDFCARSIEAMFGKRADVSGVKVDLDKGEVKLALKDDSKLDDAQLKKLVTDSGYSVTAIERKPR